MLTTAVVVAVAVLAVASLALFELAVVCAGPCL